MPGGSAPGTRAKGKPKLVEIGGEEGPDGVGTFVFYARDRGHGVSPGGSGGIRDWLKDEVLPVEQTCCGISAAVVWSACGILPQMRFQKLSGLERSPVGAHVLKVLFGVL